MNRVLFKSQSVEWATPVGVYDELNREFQFDFDPCPLGGTEDGLVKDWSGRRVFCNPPYGPGIGEWLRKSTNTDLCVFLLPARTDTRWFHELVLPFAKEIRFVRGRIKFRDSDPSWKPGGHTAPFASMIVVFGQQEKP